MLEVGDEVLLPALKNSVRDPDDSRQVFAVRELLPP
jgi:hypothetical protein